MRQTDLLVGDVICFSDGSTYLVLERDTVIDDFMKREYIRYLNLMTGVRAPRQCVGPMNPIRGEVLRGRESVWVGDEGRPNGLSPDFLAGIAFGKW